MAEVLTDEQKKQRYQAIAKIIVAAAICFAVSPIIFAVVKGLLGLIIAGGVGFTALQLTPWFAMKIANLRKLVPVGANIVDRVTGVYRVAKINYPGLTNGPVTTIAPVAVLMTKTFGTPEKQNAQRALRGCFTEKLDWLKDNGSRNWSDVTAGDQGTLNNYLELPQGTTVHKK